MATTALFGSALISENFGNEKYFWRTSLWRQIARIVGAGSFILRI